MPHWVIALLVLLVLAGCYEIGSWRYRHRQLERVRRQREFGYGRELYLHVVAEIGFMPIVTPDRGGVRLQMLPSRVHFNLLTLPDLALCLEGEVAELVWVRYVSETDQVVVTCAKHSISEQIERQLREFLAHEPRLSVVASA
ncbi:MAG TPA: hypothetical protein VMT30_06635 [Candidatus Saccharimonadia bacterium]|nr:hypothetical protein [Candidatus Saccharimonadia bacterium]